MSGVNRVHLIGRLGKDPEAKTIQSGEMVVNFSIATSETYKDRVTGEKKETTDWHNIVLWKGPAEVAAKYLHKGDMVYIEGKLRTRSWEKDGITRYTTEVIGSNISLLGGKSSGESPAAQPRQEVPKSTPNAEVLITTDDLPF